MIKRIEILIYECQISTLKYRALALKELSATKTSSVWLDEELWVTSYQISRLKELVEKKKQRLGCER